MVERTQWNTEIAVDDDGYVSFLHVVLWLNLQKFVYPFFEQFPHIKPGFVDMYKIRMQTLLFHISPVWKPVELKWKRILQSTTIKLQR